MNGFVTAYAATTGVKQRIPAGWLDHPVFGKQFRRTPADRDAILAAGPSDAWTVAELTDYATKTGIDLAGATRKADILSAILATSTPDAGE